VARRRGRRPRDARLPAKDIEREIWDGYRLGPDAAPAVLGVDAALPLDELDRLMQEKIANQPSVWIPSGMPGLQAQLDGWLERVRRRERQGDEAPRVQRDLAAVLAEMRLLKDAGELATMRRAAAISAGAHARAMRFCAEAFRRDPAAGIPSTSSRPSCCTNSAATAPTAPPTRRSSPPAPTPACSTTRRRAPSFAPASSA
jgi:Xaa-Pro aminopeptidase